MGRFHRHADGTVHEHDHGDEGHEHGSPARDVGDHSGYLDTGTARVEVLERILDENDRVAAANRAELRANGVRTVNLMSSPGAGKTTLLKRTLATLAGRGCASACSRATSPPVSTPTSWTASARPWRSSTPAPGSAASATSTR